MPVSLHSQIERVMIVGIILGAIGMFQPWVFALFGWGFLLLAITTLGFTIISNVPVRKEQ